MQMKHHSSQGKTPRLRIQFCLTVGLFFSLVLASFSSWSGCQSTSGTGNQACNVSMTQSRTVTANYSSSGLTLGEALDNAALTWTTGGSANWYPQTDQWVFGGSAAASGTITHNQQSWIETTVTGPGTLRYQWRVSSESGYDFLVFYRNGTLQSEISGEVDWTLAEQEIPAGTHTLRWEYAKDSSLNAGSDRGWLDRVIFETSATAYTLNVNSTGASGVAITANPSAYSGTTDYSVTVQPSSLDVQQWIERIAQIEHPQESPTVVEQRHQALLEKAISNGSVPVIVRLKLTLLPEAGLDVSQIQQQRSELSQLQERVLNRLSATQSRSLGQLGVKRFALTPGFAIWADEQMLRELLADQDVLNLVEDELNAPGLWESIPLIGGDQHGTFDGQTGQGWVVAVLDTGVEKTHPFLTGKVVAEACYSTTSSTFSVSSLCPGGAASSTAPGSGADCASSIHGCGHGTHVAGIAAGRGTSFSGVAKNADIIAIQVFSHFDSTDYCGSSVPCALSFNSDVILGLERVFALRSSYQIAAANMSLGGGRYYSHCDEDLRKPAIDQLRTAGIATVIASGNSGYTDSIGAPACISTAISVGSTTKSDDVSSFSNSASFLDLLAPGSDINSSVLNGQYARYNGTSMAAPHVAGAWAVLKQAKPSATVAEIRDALVNTGRSITDSRTGAQSRVKSRIRVDQAVATLALIIHWSKTNDFS